jgi:hypothetical protein
MYAVGIAIEFIVDNMVQWAECRTGWPTTKVALVRRTAFKV